MSRHNRDRRAALALRKRATSPSGAPSFLSEEPLELVEVDPGRAKQLRHINEGNAYLRAYRLGECSVIVTKEFGRWHLSIAHKSREPAWREIAEARYRLLPGDVTIAMILPPLEDYINMHKFCFQMVEVTPEDEVERLRDEASACRGTLDRVTIQLADAIARCQAAERELARASGTSS